LLALAVCFDLMVQGMRVLFLLFASPASLLPQKSAKPLHDAQMHSAAHVTGLS